ncbi:hypothetical protein B0H15DRAFT_808068 [Mycena belliarum]|uniref:Hemerythrin-like domain-containing protein n=1 Tax=Mycena belliarum TaxID=1033014 RepID=A0AAD6XUM8_9AGAR|nr:hypothetical protein B0H15DRAFT_808068 [Mycena belliae]
MPFPYPLIARPPGDWQDPFDNQAIEMSVSHNMFIRGLNALHAQAPGIRPEQVKAFAFFAISFFEMVETHHNIEETYLFPFYDAKLGAGAMAGNVAEHASFMPAFAALHAHLKSVHAGAAPYDGAAVAAQLAGFADALVAHLTAEIPTLAAARLRAVFTRAELKAMEDELVKVIMKDISLWTTLPMGLLCHDKSTAPYFPPMPAPILWAVQYGFSWRHRDAWEFAPCDVYGRLKPGMGNDTA